MSNPENFLALEPLLVARLAEQLADLSPKVHVLTAVDLAAVTESTQITPAIHVIYNGHRVTESDSTGRKVRVEQTWLAVVATRNVRKLATGEAARGDAGRIAARVWQSLMGFKPVMLSKPLKLVNGPNGGFSAGFQYLPLAFVAELVLIV